MDRRKRTKTPLYGQIDLMKRKNKNAYTKRNRRILGEGNQILQFNDNHLLY